MGKPDAVLIGIDWGTSNLRAHLIDGDGKVIETRRSDAGILKVAPGGFQGVVLDMAGDWLAPLPGVPVIACGMVGSRQGWREVPYTLCPAALNDLAAGLATVSLEGGRDLHLVPGVAWRAEDGTPDVIRGEETKIIGAVAHMRTDTVDRSDGDALVCLPGTHAKWARVSAGALRSFRTAMSGEVYQVMLEHSILGRMMRRAAPFSAAAFSRGVARAASPGGLLHHLFSLRTLRLFDELDEDQAPSYLSGLLIGADVLAMRGDGFPGPVHVVGEGAASAAYRQALQSLGETARWVPGDAAVASGLARIAHAAGLLH